MTELIQFNYTEADVWRCNGNQQKEFYFKVTLSLLLFIQNTQQELLLKWKASLQVRQCIIEWVSS